MNSRFINTYLFTSRQYEDEAKTEILEISPQYRVYKLIPHLIRKNARFIHFLQEVGGVKSMVILKVDLQECVVHGNRQGTWGGGEGGRE